MFYFLNIGRHSPLWDATTDSGWACALARLVARPGPQLCCELSLLVCLLVFAVCYGWQVGCLLMDGSLRLLGFLEAECFGTFFNGLIG